MLSATIRPFHAAGNQAGQSGRTAWRRLIVPAHLTVSIDGGGMTLFCKSRGLMFRANSTGADIWNGISVGQDPDRIASELCRKFGLGIEDARQHVASFVDSLIQNHLLLPGVEAKSSDQ